MNQPTRKFALSSVFSITTLLTGCGGDDVQFKYGPFTASYYFEDDGQEAGVGTDGSDDTIIPIYISEEETLYPSINYIWDDFLDVDSYNFHGVWEGELEVFDPAKPINANFDASWSDVSFYVDDALIEQWNNSSQIIPLSLEKGIHQIRVEYHNHWHTTGFNVSFTNYPALTVDTANVEIEPLVTEDTKIVYVGSYESSTLYNEITVTIPEYNGPIMLFLASYESINWVFNNPNETEISAVIVRSNNPGANLKEEGGASIFEVTDLSRTYDEFSQVNMDIEIITGRLPDYTFGGYALSEVIIPSFD